MNLSDQFIRLRKNPQAELSPEARELQKTMTDLFCKIFNLFVTANGKATEEEMESACKEQMEPILGEVAKAMGQLIVL